MWQTSGPRGSVKNIYVVRSGEFCKIGITDHMLLRLKSFRNANPHELSVVLYANVIGGAAREVERLSHEIMALKKHRNEWFQCRDKEAIEAVQNAAKSLGFALENLSIEDRQYGITSRIEINEIQEAIG